MRPFFCILALLTGASLALGQVPANVKVGKGFAIPYHEGTVLKAAFTGQDADPVPGGKVLVKQFVLKTFRDGDENKIDMIVEAPECLFDRSSYMAESAGPLKVYTASTNYFIEGEGFRWQQSRTNAHLTISNKVHTLIQREGTNKSAAKAPPPLVVWADHFEFEAQTEEKTETRVATYERNVRVEDPEMKLSCGVLHVGLPSEGSRLRRIVAQDDVVILGADGSRATARKADYFSDGVKETVSLTGAPRWVDAQKREATAQRFVLDRTARTVRAENDARMRLPRQGGEASGLLAFGATTQRGSAAPAGTNTIEITARVITAQLPSTNGPVQKIIAETNVVIFSETDRSRATSDRAVYVAESASVELTGNPRWQVGGSEVAGQVLTIGLTNKMFSAAPEARLKLPATTLARSVGGAGSTNAKLSTNQFLEIQAAQFNFRNNRALFETNVVARLTDGTNLLGSLQSRFLEITFSEGNQVERVFARGGVKAEQIPPAGPTTRVLRKQFAAEELAVDLSPSNGLLRAVMARGDVAGEQVERHGAIQRSKAFNAGKVDVRFAAATNRIESLVAEQNVKLRQDQSWASGQKAIYGMGTNGETFELTGKPLATVTQAQTNREPVRVLISDAVVLLWEPATGKVKARGPFRIVPVSEETAAKQLSPKSQ